MIEIIQDSPSNFRVLFKKERVGTITFSDGKWLVNNLSQSYKPQRFKNLEDAFQVFGKYSWGKYLGESYQASQKFQPKTAGICSRWSLS